MKYTLPTVMRGQQIHKVCFATSNKKAADILKVSSYAINNYASKQDSEPFEGIFGYMDSGQIIFGTEEKNYTDNRKDLHSKLLPIKELEDIIDKFLKEKYKDFNHSIGHI